MKIPRVLNFSGRHHLPIILQSERAECGLACLAMVVSYHGLEADLASLRHRFGSPSRGTSLDRLKQYASALGFSTRALRLEPEVIERLRRPAILHWDMNHFVVLKDATRQKIIINDPRSGERHLCPKEASRHFTGVALELSPMPGFEPKIDRIGRLRMRSLWEGLHGVRKIFAQVLLVSLVLQIVTLAGPLLLQFSVDEVLGSNDTDLLATLVLGFGMLVLFEVAIETLRGFTVLFLSTHMNVHMVTRLVNRLTRLPTTFFERRHVGDIVSRFDSLRSIQRTLTTNFIESVVDGLVAVPLLVVMFAYSFGLSLLVIGTLVLYFSIHMSLYRAFRDGTEQQIVHDARRKSVFLETVRGIQTIRLFGREAERESVLQNIAIDSANAGIRVGRLRIGFRAANRTLFGLQNVAVIGLGVLLILEGALSAGMLFAFIMWKRSFSDKAIRLVENFSELRMLRLHADRVADIALAEPETEGYEAPLESNDSRGALRLTGVSFRYGADEPFVLENVSFDVMPGEWVAIVGPSGCGKSTLMKIMTGLLRPETGQVLVDGQDILQYGLRNHRARIGAVMQDDGLFAGTIGENISFLEEAPDNKRVEECARLAAVHDDIVSMPMAYRTLVGDMGSLLSGGQKQRLLLARALYRQPDILILDEATSHLDSQREEIIMNNLSNLSITRVIIAHRADTVARANRVIDFASLCTANAAGRG